MWPTSLQTSDGPIMDNTSTQPDHQSKAEWKAPELLRLDINAGTQQDYSGSSSPDGNWGLGAS